MFFRPRACAVSMKALPEVLRLAKLRGLEVPEEAPRDKLDLLSSHHQGLALKPARTPTPRSKI